MCERRTKLLAKRGLVLFITSNFVGWSMYFSGFSTDWLWLPIAAICLSLVLIAHAMCESSEEQYRQPSEYEPLDPIP